MWWKAHEIYVFLGNLSIFDYGVTKKKSAAYISNAKIGTELTSKLFGFESLFETLFPTNVYVHWSFMDESFGFRV